MKKWVEILSGERRMVIRDYAVCYFDLLGQRDGLLHKVREAKDTTTVQREVELVSDAIRNFNIAIASAKEKIVSEPDKLLKFVGFPQDRIDESLPSIKNLSFGIQQFSDTTVFYVNADSRVGLGVFNSWCRALSLHYLGLVASGILIRGGIAIGKGWELSPNCLYGPVLEDVYHLEGEVADCPRIVTTHEVYRQLAEVDRLDALDCAQPLPSFLRCAELFGMDFDGAYILDYLSVSAIKGHKLLFRASGNDIAKVVKEGMRFICDKKDELQNQASNDINKAKVAKKIALLKSYWLQRIEMALKECDSDKTAQNECADIPASHA